MRKLIIDTNILLLLVIGSVENGQYISRSKRLQDYDIDDFYSLIAVLPTYDVYITPYIAAEMSNLIDLVWRAREEVHAAAGAILSGFEQVEVSVRSDVRSSLFGRFGLADCSLVNLVTGYTILTNDERLLPSLYRAMPGNVLPFALVRAVRSR